MLLNGVFDFCLNMVFNSVMNDAKHPDATLIDQLGGPTKVATLLGYGKEHAAVQRVRNWLYRGIPAQVKVDHPEIFLISSKPPHGTWNGKERRFVVRRADDRAIRKAMKNNTPKGA
jgi:hypothetical protein